MDERTKNYEKAIANCVEAMKRNEINEEVFKSENLSESPEMRECRLRSMAYSLNEIYASMRKLTSTIKSVGSNLVAGMVISALYMLFFVYVMGMYQDNFFDVCMTYVMLIGSSTLLYWYMKGPRSATHFRGTYTAAIFYYGFKICAFLFAPVLLLAVAWFPGALLHSAVDWIPEAIFMVLIFLLPFIQLAIILICGIGWSVKHSKLNHYKAECQESLNAQEYAEFSLYFDQICNSAVYA